MEPALLSQITQLFKNGALVWGPTISGIVEPWYFDTLLIAWFFAFFGIAFNIGVDFFPALFLFFIRNGFFLSMIRFGPEWINQLFDSIKNLGYRMGMPNLDPSAIAAMGPVVADPIMKSLADQGMLSYLFSPSTYIFSFAGVAVEFAFLALAFMTMATLILSYVLTAGCPFFFVFAAIPFTRGMTMGYVRLVFGTLATLFTILLITANVVEVGELIQVWERAVFLNPAVTLTASDYALPLGVAIVLTCMFIWLPIKVGREMYGFVPEWSGGRAAGFALGGVRAAGGAAQDAFQKMTGGGGSHSSSGGGGSPSRTGGGGSPKGTLGTTPWGFAKP